MRRNIKIQLQNWENKVAVMSQKTGHFSKWKIGKNILKKQRINPRGPISNQNRKKKKQKWNGGNQHTEMSPKLIFRLKD